jgi:hypothetical protein
LLVPIIRITSLMKQTMNSSFLGPDKEGRRFHEQGTMNIDFKNF